MEKTSNLAEAKEYKWALADVPEYKQIVYRHSISRNRFSNTDASMEISETRFSIGAKRKEEYARIFGKHRPDLDVDATIAEIDKLDDTKKEKVALHWIVRGTIRLPEDAYKIDDALSVAGKAKVAPFRYPSPDTLLLAHKEFKPATVL